MHADTLTSDRYLRDEQGYTMFPKANITSFATFQKTARFRFGSFTGSLVQGEQST